MYYYKGYTASSPVGRILSTWKTKALLLTLVLLMQGFCSLAQVRQTVFGKITSGADNNALPGVSILVKGTSNGVASDANGNFTLEAGSNDVLVISFIGFVPQEVPVGNRTNLNITLKEDQKMLSEVVVVGYGEIPRSDLTSAQTTIGAAEIQKTVNTTVEQAIQGRAAGVYVTQNTGQPGGGISVNVRGINSLTGSNEPLYVIDGVQMGGGSISFGATSSTNPLAGLNPADIESMEILQGPSSTAIYGSRGTNGVVLITTKRGKAGEMKVNYGYLYTNQDKPPMLETMNLREFAVMRNEIQRITGQTPSVEFQDPSILGEGTNWQEALFKRAPLHKHQVSLQGGGEKTQFYVSGEYFDQEGVAAGSSFKRYGTRLNLDNQPRKWLKIGTNLNLSQTNEELGTSQENLIMTALTMSPNVAIVNPNGTWGGPDETNGSSVQFTPLNPIALADLIQNNYTRRNAQGGLNLDVTILKGLVFRTALNGNMGFTSSKYFTPQYQLGSRLSPPATLSKSNSVNTWWSWNQLLQYTASFGKHDINVMASHESQENQGEGLSGNRTNFVVGQPLLRFGDPLGQTNDDYMYHGAMESYLGRLVYTFNDKYVLQSAFRTDGSSNFGEENRWGFFPSVSAAWRVSQEPFMKSVSFINDLKLRVETGLTGNSGSGAGIYSPLSSIATTWGAGFYAGRFGNQNLQWEETLTKNVGFNLSLFQNRIQLEGDVYIKNTDNLLLAISLPDYMGTAGEGSIGPPTVNIGAMENKGYAFSINTVNIDRGDLTWNTNFNISGFRPKIKEFYTKSSIYDRVSWWMDNWTQRSIVGQAPWLMRGYVEEGLFQSLEEINNSALPTRNGVELPVNANDGVWVGDIKYKDLDGNQVIDERDQTFIGNPWPKMTFGFTNTVNYKGFDLSVLLTGSYGNDVFNYVRFINTRPNNIYLGRNMLKETYNYARITGDAADPRIENAGTNVARISGSNANGNGLRITDKFVEDGSYIRIKSLNLGYSVPKIILARQGFVQGARVALGMQNLATFTKYKGMDPEVGAYVGRDASSSNQSIGLDFGRYPLTRMYTFSVDISF